MHRRSRHLNPLHAGAIMALDARYLLVAPHSNTNNDTLSSWPDMARLNDATQDDVGEIGSKPTFLTNILGGNPVVRFDGSNDVMTHAITRGNVNSTVLWVAKALSSQASYKHMVSFTQDSLATYHSWSNAGGGVTNKWSSASAVGTPIDSGITATTAFVVGYGIRNGSTHYIGTDGVERNSGTISSYYGGDTNGRQTIGGRADSTECAHVDLAAVVFIESNLQGTGLLKRLVHSLGFSYKIACS